MPEYVRSALAEQELSGCRIIKVVRKQLPDADSGYEHSLILESADGITRQVPVGNSLTIHSFTSPNVFEGV